MDLADNPFADAPGRLNEDGNEADFEVGVGNLVGVQQLGDHRANSLAPVGEGRFVEHGHAGVERCGQGFLHVQRR